MLPGAVIRSAEVSVPLPAMAAFVEAHFRDLRLMKAYLERATGAEVHEEQLVMGKVRACESIVLFVST